MEAHLAHSHRPRSCIFPPVTKASINEISRSLLRFIVLPSVHVPMCVFFSVQLESLASRSSQTGRNPCTTWRDQ